MKPRSEAQARLFGVTRTPGTPGRYTVKDRYYGANDPGLSDTQASRTGSPCGVCGCTRHIYYNGRWKCRRMGHALEAAPVWEAT